MTRLWISDFRGKPLEFWMNNAALLDEESEVADTENENPSNDPDSVEDGTEETNETDVTVLPENTFISDNNADLSWLTSYITQQLLTLEVSDLAVIIMLGFNDCVYSCTWDSLPISAIAENYCKAFAELVEQYKSADFYFCSVNPVTESYPKMTSTGELISKDALNARIKEFNELIKNSDIIKKDKKITYIDSHSYFEETGFKTRDGIRYTPETCIDLQEYIENKIKIRYAVTLGTPANFKPRTTAPSKDNKYYYSNNNPYHAAGFGMPNCTAYAWGRFYEILGERPKLSTWDAEYFYLKDGNHEEHYHENDGYKRGTTPAVGAVICWRHDAIGNTYGDAGHVGIVEWTNADGTEIITSESGWGDDRIWWRKKRTINSSVLLDADGNPVKNAQGKDDILYTSGNHWGATGSYYFQGFIYNPAVTGSGTSVSIVPVTKKDVTSSNEYLGYETDEKGYFKKPSEKMLANGLYIWNYLGSRGWTLNAVAGLLGNLTHESHVNPGLGEVGGYGYGLAQWTGPSKLYNWCYAQKPQLKPSDIDAQLARIEHERDHNLGDCYRNSQGKKSDCGCSQYWYATIDGYGIPYTKTFGPNTLHEFSRSNESPHHLACAFLQNYEKPSGIIWGCIGQDGYERGLLLSQAERDATRDAVRKQRGTCAERWFEILAPYAPGALERLSLTNLKTTSLEPTQAKFSFITKLSSGGTYKISSVPEDKSKNKEGTLTIKSEEDKTEEDKTEETASEKEQKESLESFSVTGLTPNTRYKVFVELEEKQSETVTEKPNKNKVSDTLYFSTPQDYPERVSTLEIAIDNSNFLKSLVLSVSAEPVTNWGYWKKNSCGYLIKLIINGNVIAAKEADSLTSFFDIDLKSYFPNIFNFKDASDCPLRLDDNIQIGILSWTKDDQNKLVYNPKGIKVSNVINLLNQSFITYLNTN